MKNCHLLGHIIYQCLFFLSSIKMGLHFHFSLSFTHILSLSLLLSLSKALTYSDHGKWVLFNKICSLRVNSVKKVAFKYKKLTILNIGPLYLIYTKSYRQHRRTILKTIGAFCLIKQKTFICKPIQARDLPQSIVSLYPLVVYGKWL